jgi:hypothetical protein
LVVTGYVVHVLCGLRFKDQGRRRRRRKTKKKKKKKKKKKWSVMASDQQQIVSDCMMASYNDPPPAAAAAVADDDVQAAAQMMKWMPVRQYLECTHVLPLLLKALQKLLVERWPQTLTLVILPEEIETPCWDPS